MDHHRTVAAKMRTQTVRQMYRTTTQTESWKAKTVHKLHHRLASFQLGTEGKDVMNVIVVQTTQRTTTSSRVPQGLRCFVVVDDVVNLHNDCEWVRCAAGYQHTFEVPASEVVWL